MKLMKGELREWMIAIVVVAFSVMSLFYLIPTQIEVLEDYALKCVSPRFFPKVATMIIGILGLLLIFVRINPWHKGVPPASNMMSPYEELRVVGAFAAAVFFLLVFKYIGFIPAAFLGLVLLLVIQGGLKHPLKTLGIAAATTATVYLFFHYAMNVYFDPGKWVK
jgi:hypothetical protein